MLSPVFVANSQILVQESEIGVEIIPRNPEPYETVTINVYSYATDIDKAFISWQSNGGVVLSGVGKKSFTLQAPGPDSVVSFEVVVNPVDQTTSLRKKITINPSDIDLVWESVDGYAPPFYKGKVLPTRGSIIKVVALPNSKTITTGVGKIVYAWKNNDDTIEEASGYNKNSYMFKNKIFDITNNIEVEASSVSGNYNAQKNIQIPTYNPQLVFYKKSPTDGFLFNTTINNDHVMTEDQSTFFASPYYLATNGKEGSFVYKWSVNGETISTPVKKSEITIRPSSRSGYAEISLVIENLQELFQKITSSFAINL